MSSRAPWNPSPVEAAAIQWWRAKRPAVWTEEEHAAEPTVNTITPSEKRLAAMVAEMFRDPDDEPSVVGRRAATDPGQEEQT